ncbi:hypothetical protein [Planococcus sp. ISL-110]|uniref:hypothetical protein n=1 Tax=Planococcus sp. ISL-110 TaxID=2819167 RepID=UPI001BE556D2|nr:hypothetical protein [Planococcus sp. ISL-110]MBT2571331.1 hypothetical protein [Planococcus sp. ISL-110]
MIKKLVPLMCVAFLLTACTNEEQAEDKTTAIVLETEAEEKEEQKSQTEEPVIEEVSLLDLQPLGEKKWSNTDESIYVDFTQVSESTIEFRVLKTDETPVQEFIFLATSQSHDSNEWAGTVTTTTEFPADTQVTITTQADSYILVVEDLLDMPLKETSITQEEWEEKKKTLKEMSDQEVIDFIANAESNSVQRFGEAFGEGANGYFYEEDFETILNSLENNYTDTYKSQTLREIYDNPIYMLETLYAFPMADAPVLNAHVIRAPEHLTVFTETDFYGSTAHTRYLLTAENKEWKISSRDFLISPENAPMAALSMSDEADDADAYGELVHHPDFYELVNMVQSGEYYYINTYLDYDDMQIFVAHYQVDPLTGMVYFYDRGNDSTYELGIALEE